MPRITDVPVLLPASTAPDQAAEHPAPAPPATATAPPATATAPSATATAPSATATAPSATATAPSATATAPSTPTPSAPVPDRPQQPNQPQRPSRSQRPRRPKQPRTPPRARLGPARQPRRRRPALAAGQLRRAGLGAETAAAGHRLAHRGEPGHHRLARLRHASGRDAGLAAADGDRLRVRRRRGDRAGPGGRAQPGRRERRGSAHADPAHAALVRPHPGVHRLVRHRRAAQGDPDRAGRRRSRST